MLNIAVFCAPKATAAMLRRPDTRNHNPCVGGSNPSSATTKSRNYRPNNCLAACDSGFSPHCASGSAITPKVVKARHGQTVRKRCMATLCRGKGRQLGRSFRQMGGHARRIIGGMGRRSRRSTQVRLPTNSPGAPNIISSALCNLAQAKRRCLGTADSDSTLTSTVIPR
jgi:hypothetical protein